MTAEPEPKPPWQILAVLHVVTALGLALATVLASREVSELGADALFLMFALYWLVWLLPCTVALGVRPSRRRRWAAASLAIVAMWAATLWTPAGCGWLVGLVLAFSGALCILA